MTLVVRQDVRCTRWLRSWSTYPPGLIKPVCFLLTTLVRPHLVHRTSWRTADVIEVLSWMPVTTASTTRRHLDHPGRGVRSSPGVQPISNPELHTTVVQQLGLVEFAGKLLRSSVPVLCPVNSLKELESEIVTAKALVSLEMLGSAFKADTIG